MPITSTDIQDCWPKDREDFSGTGQRLDALVRTPKELRSALDQIIATGQLIQDSPGNDAFLAGQDRLNAEQLKRML